MEKPLLSKIYNLQMSKTICMGKLPVGYNSVIPFEQSIFMDTGVYARYEESPNAYLNTYAYQSNKVFTDIWMGTNVTYQNNTSSLIEIQSEPNYEFNKANNKVGGFATYKGSTKIVGTDNEFSYLFLSALNVIKSILSDDYYKLAFQYDSTPLQQQVRVLKNRLVPSQILLENLPNLGEDELVDILCTYSAFFLIVDFSEPHPEITNEYRLAKDILSHIENNWDFSVSPRVKDIYLSFLGMLYRGTSWVIQDNAWIAVQVPNRTFNCQMSITTSHLTKSNKLNTEIKEILSELEEEINRLTGYLPEFNRVNSYNEYKNKIVFMTLLDNYIKPSLSRGTLYKGAKRIAKYMNNSEETFSSKLENLKNVIINLKAELEYDSNKVSYNLSRTLLLETIDVYLKNREQFQNMINSKSIGDFLLTYNRNSSQNLPVPQDVSDDTVTKIIENGFIPFGHTLNPFNTNTSYGDSGTQVSYYHQTMGVNSLNKIYYPILSKPLYHILDDNKETLSSRIDTLSVKYRVSDGELLSELSRLLIIELFSLLGENPASLSGRLDIDRKAIARILTKEINATDNIQTSLQNMQNSSGIDYSAHIAYIKSLSDRYKRLLTSINSLKNDTVLRLVIKRNKRVIINIDSENYILTELINLLETSRTIFLSSEYIISEQFIKSSNSSGLINTDALKILTLLESITQINRFITEVAVINIHDDYSSFVTPKDIIKESKNSPLFSSDVIDVVDLIDLNTCNLDIMSDIKNYLNTLNTSIIDFSTKAYVSKEVIIGLGNDNSMPIHTVECYNASLTFSLSLVDFADIFLTSDTDRLNVYTIPNTVNNTQQMYGGIIAYS